MQEVEELAEVNDFVASEGKRFTDYLLTRVPIQAFDAAAGVLELPASPFHSDPTTLLRELAFANTVYQQYYGSFVMLSRLEDLAEIARTVLDALAEDG